LVHNKPCATIHSFFKNIQEFSRIWYVYHIKW
jgi:hypothetical protein